MGSTTNETSRAVRAWIDDFVEASLRPNEVDDFVGAVDAEILDALPELASDPGLVEDLHASTREHWRNFLVGLGGEHRLALPPAAVALSLSIARRHHDINVLLKVYRVANKSTFRYMIEHTAPESLPSGLPRDEVLLALWLRAERWIDESIEQLIDHFTTERARLTEGAQARRAETIEALVAGAPGTQQAERLLGHNLRLWQTAFVLSAPATAGQDPPLFDLAARVCHALGLPAPLTMLAGSRELWGWVATTEALEIDVAAITDLVGGEGLHLALGRSERGPSAFRSTHLQALAARRLGARQAGAAHAYGALELVCLIGDGELAREMVRRTVEPLLTGAKADETLRATLLAYLRAGQRVDAVAEALFVHPNTVRYRIGRAEELLGERVATRATMLEVCLAWLEVHGADALAADQG